MKANFFLKDVVEQWAEQYPVGYEKDEPTILVAEKAQRRGHLLHSDLITIGNWKSPRIRHLLAQNSEWNIESDSHVAFYYAQYGMIEKAVEVLTRLHGVGLPMATSILHLAGFPCPIIDYRALWSLDIPYSNSSWKGLRELIRLTDEIKQSTGFGHRYIDRAIWEFSRQNQESTEEVKRRNGKKVA